MTKGKNPQSITDSFSFWWVMVWLIAGFGVAFGDFELSGKHIESSTGTIPFDPNDDGTAEVVIDSNGNVGISTTSPSANLDVSGNLRVTGNIIGTITVDSSGKISLPDGSSSAPALTFATNTTIGMYLGSSQHLRFVTNGTDRLHIDDNGNVGISRTSTSARLDIATGSNSKGIRLRGLDEAGEVADLYMGTAGQMVVDLKQGTDNSGFMDYRTESTSFGFLIRESDGTGTSTYANLYVKDDTEDYLNFVINATGSNLGLVINENDEVGIGVLPIDGSALSVTGNVYPNSTSGAYDVGSQTYYFGNVYTKDLVLLSDERRKKEVEDLAYGLDHVMQLRPVSYHWKEGRSEQKSLGFIAQEVQPIVDEAVKVSSNEDQTMGMNYISLLPVMVKAIQDQQQIIEKQNELLKAQQLKLDTLNLEFNQVKNNLNSAGRRED